MDSTIQGRFFLVGCPRSGTTLVQSMIAAHRDVASFPESHFFKHLLPVTRWLRSFGIASTAAREVLKAYVDTLDEPSVREFVPSKHTLRVQTIAAAFVDMLDTIAQRNGATYWLEKTPGHVHHVKVIQERVPDAKFIHLIRNGTDVVASLYDVTRKYPDEWDGPWSLDRCVHQWIDDVSATLEVRDRAHHHVIRYEHVTANPEEQVRALFDSLGLSQQSDTLERRTATVDKIRTPDEDWKSRVGDDVYDANESKFYTLLSKDQQEHVLKKIEESGLKSFLI